MAKVQNTLIGRASGSVGGATFSSWRGINVLKEKAENVANPRTIGQVSQRNRLTLMVSIYRAISSAVQIGFRSRAIMQSAYNAFVSSNIVNATTVSTSGDATLAPTKLKTSLGTIGTTAIDAVQATNQASSVALTFSSSTIPIGGNSTDRAIATVYNETKDQWASSLTGMRSTGTAAITLQENLDTGDVLHFYLFFESTTTNITSDSTYITDTV